MTTTYLPGRTPLMIPPWPRRLHWVPPNVGPEETELIAGMVAGLASRTNGGAWSAVDYTRLPFAFIGAIGFVGGTGGRISRLTEFT